MGSIPHVFCTYSVVYTRCTYGHLTASLYVDVKVYLMDLQNKHTMLIRGPPTCDLLSQLQRKSTQQYTPDCSITPTPGMAISYYVHVVYSCSTSLKEERLYSCTTFRVLYMFPVYLMHTVPNTRKLLYRAH